MWRYLGGGLGVANLARDELQVGGADLQPGGVGVADVVDADFEIDFGPTHGLQPDSGAERGPRDRSALAGREQQVVGSQPSDADSVGEPVDEVAGSP
jgi:hypothetical protein